MRRWVKVSVTVAAVLSLGGWIAEPYVQDWWLVRTACDGVLPGDAVRQLAADGSHFKDADSAAHPELGDYGCRLSFEGDEINDERLLEMDAYTRRDDQDRQFYWSFPQEGFSPQAPMPDGLPGFIDQYNTLQLLLPCPDLGKDAEGRQRKLFVRTWLGRDTARETPAAYETAVALANSASDRLGCGAEPLKVPKGDLAPADPNDDPKTVPLDQAGDTACGWAVRAGLPRPATWRLAARMNNAAPTGRCDLFSGDDESDDGERQLTFIAWYGDWSNRLVVDDDGERRPSTATARCDGEAANFALSASDYIPGVKAARQRELLKAFARDQVQERGCSDLRMID